MSSSTRPIALITGPTSGIGSGYARRLASLGYDLILVARDEQRLTDLSVALAERYGTMSEVLVADLAAPDGCRLVCDRLSGGVAFLVNNAGIGLRGDLWELDADAVQRQLDLNITAVTQLTHAALPPMIAAAKGTIVNVGSVAGIVPLRGATYSGSKAYVIAFSEALSYRLAGTGVRIQAVCPGFVHTEFHERAGIPMESTPNILWLEVDDVVKASFHDLDKGRVICVPGLQYKVITGASRLVPRRLLNRIARTVVQGRGGVKQ